MYKNFFTPKRTILEVFNFIRAYFLMQSLLPLAVSLQLTTYCNKNCKVCFESQENNPKKNINFNLVKKIANEMEGKGIFFLTGGEPFLHPRIWEILEHLKDKNINFTICTNGSTLNKKRISRLAEVNPDSVMFSVHGLKRNHDKQVGVEGSFKKIITSINELKRSDFSGNIVINVTISFLNYKELGKITKKFEKINVDAIRFQHLNFLTSNEMKKAKKEFENENVKHYVRDKKNDVKGLKKEIKKIKNKKNKSIFFIPNLSRNEITNWYKNNFKSTRNCFYIFRSLYIDVNGDCHNCQNIRNNIGNIKDESLFKIFNSKKSKKFRKVIKQSGSTACHRCCKL